MLGCIFFPLINNGNEQWGLGRGICLKIRVKQESIIFHGNDISLHLKQIYALYNNLILIPNIGSQLIFYLSSSYIDI